jgi:hypothetical protein
MLGMSGHVLALASPLTGRLSMRAPVVLRPEVRVTMTEVDVELGMFGVRAMVANTHCFHCVFSHQDSPW